MEPKVYSTTAGVPQLWTNNIKNNQNREIIQKHDGQSSQSFLEVNKS